MRSSVVNDVSSWTNTLIDFDRNLTIEFASIVNMSSAINQ